MSFAFRKEKNQLLLMTGDSSGDLVVSELAYSNKNLKIESLDVVFRRRAHKGQISAIVPCSHEDVILTASQDGSIA